MYKVQDNLEFLPFFNLVFFNKKIPQKLYFNCTKKYLQQILQRIIKIKTKLYLIFLVSFPLVGIEPVTLGVSDLLRSLLVKSWIKGLVQDNS